MVEQFPQVTWDFMWNLLVLLGCIKLFTSSSLERCVMWGTRKVEQISSYMLGISIAHPPSKGQKFI